MTYALVPPVPRSFEVRFEPLFQAGRTMAFPCDEAGNVDIDALSESGRINYLFARAMIGREFAYPVVRGL